jgi:hypothetical protein
VGKTCLYEFAGTSGKALWSFDGQTLLVTPEDGPPWALPIRECSSIQGDGYDLALGFARGALQMGRLGQDGATLLEELRRLWPMLRADALRLTGTGKPEAYSCALNEDGPSVRCTALVYEDAVLVAPEGRDLEPIFLSLIDGVSFDEARYAVALKEWEGRVRSLLKVGARTEELLARLGSARAGLSGEASQVFQSNLPGLGATERAQLSSVWPPGRMATMAELERAAPGFVGAFTASWLSQSLRRKEAEALMEWASRESVWIGFGRPGTTVSTTHGSEEEVPGESEQAGTEEMPEARADGLLWLLACRGSQWLLEALTEPDHATYRFEGRDEMPSLVSRLLCAPQFSREALYLPLDSLTGDRADLSSAARDLGFLRDLRMRFRGRVIHSGFTAWKRDACGP